MYEMDNDSVKALAGEDEALLERLLRRSALALVDAVERKQGIQPRTKELRDRHRKERREQNR